MLAVVGDLVASLGRGGRRQHVIAGVVLPVLVVLSACGGSDDDSDSTATTRDRSTTTEPAEDDSTSTSEEAASQAEPPECFEDHLAGSPVVDVEDHQRLVEGIGVEVVVVDHSEEAIALELEDADEVIGVMRVGDGGLSDIEVLVFDLVDASCTRVPFTPQQTADEVNNTMRTVVPFQLAGRPYEVVFEQEGDVDPTPTTTFRRTA
jgi:hypothetical protein